MPRAAQIDVMPMLVITGGGGFIGSVLAAALNEAGRSDLVIVDRFGTGDKWRNIAKRDFFEIVPVEGLFDWLDRFGGEVEAVFHLGAISETTFADADEIIAQQPQLFDRAVALVRGAAQKAADLRLVGRDLWRRLGRVRRCRRHRTR